MNHTATSVASIITEAIETSGLSEREIADQSGVARSTLRRRLTLGGFTVEELSAIGNVLGLRPSVLLARAERAAS